MLIGHYASVTEDAGPSQRTELPVPLRGLDFGEDLWRPGFATFLSLFVCYFPVLLTLPFKNIPVTLLFLAGGTFLFPGIFLIRVCSGLLADLRPDRVIGTIAVCGWRYVVALGLWISAAAIYGWGMIRTARWALSLGEWLRAGPVTPLLDWLALIAGIFLMHIFSVFLAHLYLRFHAQFPWAIPHKTLEREGRKRKRRRLHMPAVSSAAPVPVQPIEAKIVEPSKQGR